MKDKKRIPIFISRDIKGVHFFLHFFPFFFAASGRKRLGLVASEEQKKDTHIYQLRFYRCPFSSLFFSPFFLLTPLSFRTGIVRNPSDRDSNLSEHSPPCEVDPVQSMYGMTAESVGKRTEKWTPTFSSRETYGFPILRKRQVLCKIKDLSLVFLLPLKATQFTHRYP